MLLLSWANKWRWRRLWFYVRSVRTLWSKK